MQVALGAGGPRCLAAARVGADRRDAPPDRALPQPRQLLAPTSCSCSGRRLPLRQHVGRQRSLGRPESELLGDGFARFVHEDDRAAVSDAERDGRPARSSICACATRSGEWRHLEAHVTDLRHDRHVRGVVLNARDITERVRLEQRADRSRRSATSFGSQLIEALEMADEEGATYDVVERAMVEISADARWSCCSRTPAARTSSAPPAARRRRPGVPRASRRSRASPCGAATPVVFDSSESAQRLPEAARSAGRRRARRSACRSASWAARSACCTRPARRARRPTPPQVAQLTTLATQAGARIGTVRAFQKTPAAGLDRRPHRPRQPPHARGAAARPDQARPATSRSRSPTSTTSRSSTTRTATRPATARCALFAQVAQDVLRDDDVVARWGGEEFVIVLPDLDRHQAVAVLERMRAAPRRSAHRRPPALHRQLRGHRLHLRPSRSSSCCRSPTRPVRRQGGRPRPHHGQRTESRGSGVSGRSTTRQAADRPALESPRDRRRG